MIADKVYKGFVLPGYSEAKEQAEKAEQRALEAETENARLMALLEKLQKAR